MLGLPNLLASGRKALAIKPNFTKRLPGTARPVKESSRRSKRLFGGLSSHSILAKPCLYTVFISADTTSQAEPLRSDTPFSWNYRLVASVLPRAAGRLRSLASQIGEAASVRGAAAAASSVSSAQEALQKPLLVGARQS